MCLHPGCKFMPSFNKEGETKGLYCFEHKKEGMVDVKKPTTIQDFISNKIIRK